jgi:putative PIN family toxin of toxin-antitoxin system
VRVVADTNIVASGFLWVGPPSTILRLARESRVDLFTSRPLLDELDRVLRYPRLAKHLAKKSISPEMLVHDFIALVRIVEPVPLEPVILCDPDDDAVLACAVAAKADRIISGDGDLQREKIFRDIRIVSAATFLAELG